MSPFILLAVLTRVRESGNHSHTSRDIHPINISNNKISYCVTLLPIVSNLSLQVALDVRKVVMLHTFKSTVVCW